MNLASYTFKTTQDRLEYEFYSQGPKGRIKKIVRFDPFVVHGERLFNLAFGDWNADTHSINDTVVSNNDDIDKILATIAHIVTEQNEVQAFTKMKNYVGFLVRRKDLL